MLESFCPKNVVKHCLMVSAKSYDLAGLILLNGSKIDAELCKVGGLIHDIGRYKSHGLNHGIIGAEMLKNHPQLARIAKTHVGGGISKQEAIDLKLGNEDLMPVALEEKVVCYADKLVQGNRFAVNADEEIEKLRAKLGKNHASIKRLRAIEDEINKLIKKV